MKKWTITEMLDYKRNNDLYKDNTFLLQDYYDPPENATPETPDTRPDFVKNYVDTVYATNKVFDDVIGSKYGEFRMFEPRETVEQAYREFYMWCITFVLTHNAELTHIYKAYTEKFDPRENYDRYEETNVNTDMSSGATSKTAPDDSETFFNVGQGDSTTQGDVLTTGHIHGNIGVVDAPTMARNVFSTFGQGGWIDYFIERMISESCYLVDNGINII